MKVKDLVKKLLEMDQEAVMMQAIDSEGNGFEFTGSVASQIIDEDGEVWETSWTAIDVGMEEDEWKEFCSYNKNAVVLYP